MFDSGRRDTMRAVFARTFRWATAFIAVAALTAQNPAPTGGPTLDAVRSRIKHVFVIFQENHSFDNYFGTYPGAENLASPLAQAHGFRQYDPIGKQWVTPFRITDPDTSSPSQNRGVIEAKMNGAAMDRFVAVQEKVSSKEFGPSDAQSVGLI